jgi:hypothetical protein
MCAVTLPRGQGDELTKNVKHQISNEKGRINVGNRTLCRSETETSEANYEVLKLYYRIDHPVVMGICRKCQKLLWTILSFNPVSEKIFLFFPIRWGLIRKFI